MKTSLTTLLALTALLLCASPSPAFFGFLSSSPEQVTARDGVLRIDVSALSAGASKHYRFRHDGTDIRFFLVRDGSGRVRAALDACDVCWREDKGYKQEQGTMLCINCGQKFPLGRIGEIKGGCNPHPIGFSAEGDTVLIPAADLAAEAASIGKRR